MVDLEAQTRILADELVFELNKSLGFKKGGLSHSIIRPLVWRPMIRFSELATVFEYRVIQEGWQKASAWFISHFVDRVKALGYENLPREGPLVVASNHPGAYDSLVITAHLPRDDVKIISSDIPFVKKLPDTSQHMIFSAPDPQTRMWAARKAIRHLKEGGALLVFARATLEPDPAFTPGSAEELNRWSSSLGMFLRHVPETKLAISLVSGVLAPRYIKHPATLFRTGRVNKQRLSEFFQVMYQLLSPGKLMVSPNLSFTPPLTLADFGGTRDIHEISSRIIQKAREHLEYHSSQLLAA